LAHARAIAIPLHESQVARFSRPSTVKGQKYNLSYLAINKQALKLNFKRKEK
jgi:hypothetical protein